MRLYDFALAPNPRRVRMFLAEKSVEIPLVEINTREKAQFAESFDAINPLHAIPVLELDDGTCIAESVAICRYIEEVHPEPPLMGTDARDKAIVEMWNRRVELVGYAAASEAVRKRVADVRGSRSLRRLRGRPTDTGARRPRQADAGAILRSSGTGSSRTTRSSPGMHSPLPTSPHS